MAFELTGRSIVVRGEFNKAIISPKWLAAQEIVPDGPVEIRVSDRADMPRMFIFAQFRWTVAHDRLAVQPVNADEDDPGPKVANILRILKHTPVSGLGHNFSFEAAEPVASLEARLGDRIAPEIAKALGHELRTSTCEVRLSTGKDQFLTAKLSTEGPKQTIELNFHFDTADADAAKRAADESERCRERANAVLQVLTRNPR